MFHQMLKNVTANDELYTALIVLTFAMAVWFVVDTVRQLCIRIQGQYEWAYHTDTFAEDYLRGRDPHSYDDVRRQMLSSMVDRRKKAMHPMTAPVSRPVVTDEMVKATDRTGSSDALATWREVSAHYRVQTGERIRAKFSTATKDVVELTVSDEMNRWVIEDLFRGVGGNRRYFTATPPPDADLAAEVGREKEAILGMAEAHGHSVQSMSEAIRDRDDLAVDRDALNGRALRAEEQRDSVRAVLADHRAGSTARRIASDADGAGDRDD